MTCNQKHKIIVTSTDTFNAEKIIPFSEEKKKYYPVKYYFAQQQSRIYKEYHFVLNL